MLKSSLNKDEIRKFFNNRILFKNFILEEINFFEQLQKVFNRIIYLVHFNKQRILYINVNAFKKRDFEVIIYYFKKDFIESKTSSLKNKEMKSIMFINKNFLQTKQKY